jgi:Transcriptional regulatory protein, C terminal
MRRDALARPLGFPDPNVGAALATLAYQRRGTRLMLGMAWYAGDRRTRADVAPAHPPAPGTGYGWRQREALGAAMRIQLCGNLAVEAGGRDVADALPRRQGRLLLAYLVVNAGRPIRRDELIDVVWQDEPPSSPEAALSSLLTGVRRVLGSEALSGRSVLTLTLPPDAWTDLEAARGAARDAEAALARGEPAAALEAARAALDLTGRPVLAELQGEWVEQLRADVGQLRSD